MYSLDVSERISCSMFGRMRQTNGWKSKSPRSIDKNLFVFMIEGNALFRIEELNYDMKAGDILIIPAKTVYFANTESSCEYFFFHFSGEIKKTDSMPTFSIPNNSFSFVLPERTHNHIFFNLKTSDKTSFDKIYTSIINCLEYRSYSTYSGRLLIDTEFFKIMLMLGELMEKMHNRMPTVLEKMIIYIKKNLTKPISLSDVSSQCSISAPYAARLFKKYLNMTATEYINGEKLYYACELIKNTSMNMSEIANYLGYCDVFYFSKLFKRKFG
ncbi:MAG: AraC family transcriptional regulator, partial [Clostridiales bacterium]|nr:AraC family transcriptional regulator [Clostridiales bacterium]